MGKLIILRGNSGSGKTTVAKELQKKFGYNTMLISQDEIRRNILWVKDGIDTYEAPGGHREVGEDILETAKRKLQEETGAIQFDIKPICVYSVTGKNSVNETGEETFGLLCFAEITEFSGKLESEIEKVELMDELPESWTYPMIQPKLIEKYLQIERQYYSQIVDKEMSKSDLRKKAEIAPNTMTKLRRDEEVSLTILSKICKTLHADFGDIVEYVPDAEIWDLYNENRELLGKDHIRGEQLPIDGYHLVVHVWIRNSKGEYLIAQRSANRTAFPLIWECVDGSVVKGEDSLQGALREAKEEVGVDLLPEKGQVILSDIKKIEFGKVVNKIVDVWLFEYDGEVDLSNATTDEAAQVAWMNRSQIKELFDANMFVDTLEYFFMEVDK